jgi:DNA-binding CsgD family transcriptional regulator
MHGVVVLNGQDQVTYHNAAAERLLSRHAGLLMDGARLRTWYPRDAAELWAAVAGLRQGKARQQAVGLNHPDRPHPLIVLATLREDAPESLSGVYGEGEIVLYVSDPGHPFAACEEDLAALFHFTRAESGVASALVNGLSVEQIAERHQVSRETVRSQLKSIFGKLGVSKQQDVVRLLLNSGLNRRL